MEFSFNESTAMEASRKSASLCDLSKPSYSDSQMKTISGTSSHAEINLKNSSKPICVIVLGMAGSGKTSFVQRIISHLHGKDIPPYVINLDPACYSVPFPADIDIREAVKYETIMNNYKLGPNKCIMTSLNLFSTRFDQVLQFINKSSSKCKHVLFDTPGQIEVFTLSASGMIITETLSTAYPTVLVYVMDIVKSSKPVTFMSNMLYAYSILFKTKLPFIVVFNKTDVVDCQFALEWMRDFESFQKALKTDDSFKSNLSHSMSLALFEFYNNLRAVGVSSLTGAGLDEFFQYVDEAAEEYEKIVEKNKDSEKLRQEKR